MGTFDIVFKKKKTCNGMTIEDADFLFKSLAQLEAYPMEIIAKDAKASAMGFISIKAANVLNYKYTELQKFVENILNETKNEKENIKIVRRFNGLFIMIDT